LRAVGAKRLQHVGCSGHSTQRRGHAAHPASTKESGRGRRMTECCFRGMKVSCTFAIPCERRRGACVVDTCHGGAQTCRGRSQGAGTRVVAGGGFGRRSWSADQGRPTVAAKTGNFTPEPKFSASRLNFEGGALQDSNTNTITQAQGRLSLFLFY
jgi:hypothetical protein